MNQPGYPYNPPGQNQPYSNQRQGPPAEKPKAWGLFALVAGIAGLVFALVPYAGFICPIIAILYGGIGVKKNVQGGQKVMAIIGIILGVLGLVLAIVGLRLAMS
jgi:hypothetical protein